MNQVGLPRSYLQLPQVGQQGLVARPQVGAPGGALIPGGLTNWVIITGGTAIVAVTGQVFGGFITNPINAAAQGIASAENLYIDMVGVPGSTDAAANGTTVILQPGQSFYLPWLALGVQVRINAATSGHKVSGEVW
jgi:hypothetical protein